MTVTEDRQRRSARRHRPAAAPRIQRVGGWGAAAPVRCTEPLSENYTTDADWFLPIIRAAWSAADPEFELDDWQVELIRRVLETYPPGHKRAGQLRFRQVVISLARQNGKSEIGAILGIYGLLRNLARALVIGIASTAEQARIVYDRTNAVITASPALKKRFAALTDTRGIRAKAGGKYEIKAAKAASLQGLALTLGVVDELHLLAATLWNALVSGTGGRRNTLVAGITTAGDENSALLIKLYELGEKAIAGDKALGRFGFFVWEAPQARIPKTKSTFVKYLVAANPALAEAIEKTKRTGSARLDLATRLDDIAGLPDDEIIRYHFNRFAASIATFISGDAWRGNGRKLDGTFPRDAGMPWFCVERTPDWGYATITANVKDDAGLTHTELVASILKPNLDQLEAICVQLARHSPAGYAMDGLLLRDLGELLRKAGHNVFLFTLNDWANATTDAHAKIKRKQLRHANDPLLTLQMPRAVRKHHGDGFRVSRTDSTSGEIDAVMATIGGVHVAETRRATGLQIF